MASTERTLVLVKPDAFARGLTGEVLRRIEAKGYVLVALQVRTPTREMLERHYAEHVGKPFYEPLLAVHELGAGHRCRRRGGAMYRGVPVARRADSTRPSHRQARSAAISDATGAAGSMHNVVHGSDSPEAAERELRIWFPQV